MHVIESPGIGLLLSYRMRFRIGVVSIPCVLSKAFLVVSKTELCRGSRTASVAGWKAVEDEQRGEKAAKKVAPKPEDEITYEQRRLLAAANLLDMFPNEVAAKEAVDTVALLRETPGMRKARGGS